MSALSFSVSSTGSVPPPAAVPGAAVRTVPEAAGSDAASSQVSPESALNVTTGTIAAIQQLGGGDAAAAELADQEAAAKSIEPKSFQEIQAEARRWERYYAHQPRRLADLLAVYYGGQHTSLDPRGPATKPLVEYISGEPETDQAAAPGPEPRE